MGQTFFVPDIIGTKVFCPGQMGQNSFVPGTDCCPRDRVSSVRPCISLERGSSLVVGLLSSLLFCQRRRCLHLPTLFCHCVVKMTLRHTRGDLLLKRGMRGSTGGTGTLLLKRGRRVVLIRNAMAWFGSSLSHFTSRLLKRTVMRVI